MYLQANFLLKNADLLELAIYQLTQLGFDSFWEDGEQLKAYILQTDFNEARLKEFLLEQPIPLMELKKIQALASKNWNEEWEKNFEPVLVNNQVYIRANFHPQKAEIAHQILINPKMAFGTGHHATTYMMVEQMLSLNFTNKKVFDFGCGTAILSILAEQLGANQILGVDIEEWAYKNAIECCQLNNCNNIQIQQGGIDLAKDKYDIILANINRHVILNSLEKLKQLLTEDGTILFSGILIDDRNLVIEAAQKAGFKLESEHKRDKWMLLEMTV